MKKQIAFIALMLASLLCLASCAESVPDIGSYVWRMESAQSASQNGDIIAAAPDAQTNCDTIVELKLTAKNGVLTLTDAKENTVYTGTYKLSQKNLREYIYEVTIDYMEGIAVCAMTTYHDGTEEPTFIINLDGEYVLNFKAE